MSAPLRRRRTLRRGAAGLAAGWLVLTGCGSGSSAGGCDERLEPTDPRSTQHVLPGAPEPSYTTYPPTSGPHLMGTGVTGVVDGPLARPVQVGILERGDVILHHRPGDTALAAALAPLAGDSVVVMPNPQVDGAVATAWGWRLTCAPATPPDRVTDAANAFITSHADAGSRMGPG